MARRLRIDRIRCDGHGLCAQLIPERVTLDDWGFPMVDPAPVGRDLAGAARRAVAACPVLAEVAPVCGAGIRPRSAWRRSSKWAIQDSNLGPLPYQRSALTD